jgi:hypothetical protein
MANADLSRRVETVVGYQPLAEMDDRQRREFHEALRDADSFDDLPGKWRAAILTAEENRAKLRASRPLASSAWRPRRRTGEVIRTTREGELAAGEGRHCAQPSEEAVLQPRVGVALNVAAKLASIEPHARWQVLNVAVVTEGNAVVDADEPAAPRHGTIPTPPPHTNKERAARCAADIDSPRSHAETRGAAFSREVDPSPRPHSLRDRSRALSCRWCEDLAVAETDTRGTVVEAERDEERVV